MGSNNSRSLSVNYYRLALWSVTTLWFVVSVQLAHAAEHIVTTTANAGPGSLRAALAAAHADPTEAEIVFGLSTEDRYYDAVTDMWTLHVTEPLLPITKDGLIVRGPHFAERPRVVLRGTSSSLAYNTDGLVINAARVKLINIGIYDFPRSGIVIAGVEGRYEDHKLHNVHLRGHGHGERYGGQIVVTDLMTQGALRVAAHTDRVVVDHVVIEENYGSGLTMTGTPKGIVQHIEVHDTVIAHNHGYGITATHSHDVTIDGAVAQDTNVVFTGNRQGEVSIKNSARVTVRNSTVAGNQYTSPEGLMIFSDVETATIENVSMESATHGGIVFERVWEGSVLQSTFADLHPYSVQQASGRVRYQHNTFRDGSERYIYGVPRYNESVPFATMHFLGNTFAGDEFSVEHEYGCVATNTETDVPRNIKSVRPLLVKPIMPTQEAVQSMTIQGSGLAQKKLVPLTGGYYGLVDTEVAHVQSWPHLRATDAARGQIRVVAETSTQTYVGAIEVALFDACTHDQRINLSAALRGKPAPYDIAMHPANDTAKAVHQAVENTLSQEEPAITGVVEITSPPEQHRTNRNMIIAVIIMIATVLVVTLSMLMRRVRVRYQAYATQKHVRDVCSPAEDTAQYDEGNMSITATDMRRVCWSLLKDPAVFFVAAQFSVSILNYLFIVLVIRFSGAAEAAEVNVLLVVLFLSAMPAVILQDYTTYQVARLKQHARKRHVISRYCLYGGAVATVVFCSVMVTTPYVWKLTGTTSWALIVLLSIAASINYLLPVPRGAWQAERRFELLGAHLIVEALLKSIAVVVLLQVMTPFFAVLGAIICGYAVSALWLYSALMRRGHFAWQCMRTPSKTRSHFVNDGLYFLAGVVLFSILYNADLLLVQHYNTADADLYVAVARLGQLLIFGGMSVAAVFLPLFRQYAHQKSPLEMLWRPFTFVSSGIVLFFVTMIFCGDTVLRVLFGPSFVAAYPFALRVGFNMSCLALAVIGMYYLLSRGERAFLKPIAGVVGAVLLCIVLVQPTVNVMIGLFGFADSIVLSIILWQIAQVAHLKKSE